MSKGSPQVWLAGAFVVLIGAGLVAMRMAESSAPSESSPETKRDSSREAPTAAATPRTVAATGVADVHLAMPPAPTAPVPAPPATPPSPDRIGAVQPVAATANPQVAAVAEALQSKTHPERLSALIAPPAFDAAAFTADPTAYLAEVQPGRAFQTATPGEKTPVLRPLSATQVTIKQDQSVILRVVTQARAPVSFTSFDLGHFDNQLVAQTVLADANGVASVSFTPGPGTIDGVHILAGSPLASGQVSFDVSVTPAQTADTTVPAAPKRAGSGI